MQQEQVRQGPQTAEGPASQEDSVRKLGTLFKAFSVLGLLSGLIPVVYTVYVIPGAFSGRVYLWFGLNALAILPIGYLEARLVQGRFYDNVREHSPLRIVGAALSIVLALAVSVAAWFTYPQVPFDNGRGLITVASMALTNFLLYHMGRQLFYRDYYSLLSSRLAIGVGVVYGAACFVQFAVKNVLHLDYSLGPVLPFFFLFVLSYVLIRNQGSLEYLVERRKNAATNLPNKIRRYNALLLGILIGAIFVIFLFHDWIGAGMGQLLLLLKGALSGLARVYAWLVSLFSRGETDKNIYGEEGEMFDYSSVEATPSVFWDIVTVLTIALVAFLIIRYLPNILRWIGRFFRACYLKLVELASKGKEKDYSKTESNLYYSDDVETVLPQSVRPRPPWWDFRRNRAFLRELKREENPERKIRMGYGFMRQLALEAGGEAWKLKESDSPRELTGKLKDAQQAQTLETSGEIYESVRYAQQTPDLRDAAQVEQEVEALLETMKNSKLMREQKAKSSVRTVSVRKGRGQAR